MMNGHARNSNLNLVSPRSPSRRAVSPRSPQSAGLSYPNIKQRGYYSDILAEGARHDVAVSFVLASPPNNLSRRQHTFIKESV